MGLKDAQIDTLERSIQSLSAEKDNLFDQLQMRQAEVESAQSMLEVLQGQNTELRYQVREKDDRIALLNEELNDSRQGQHFGASDPSTSPEEVAKLLTAAESRHEAKLSVLKQKLASMEAERVDVEAEWERKVQAKVQEAQRWKSMVDAASQNQQDDDDRTQGLQVELERLRLAARAHDHEVSQLGRQVERLTLDEVGVVNSFLIWIGTLNIALCRKVLDSNFLSRSKELSPWITSWR
jgi:chromosome segregation ATPase